MQVKPFKIEGWWSRFFIHLYPPPHIVLIVYPRNCGSSMNAYDNDDFKVV